MIKVGLTGSIGSGKSTLARLAQEKLDIPVFDADQAVGEMYQGDDNLKVFLLEKCGAEVLQDGRVNKAFLKTLLGNPEKQALWKEIEEKVHKRVW